MTDHLIPPDAEVAARGLHAVLSHPESARAVDERFFESLLALALTECPRLARSLRLSKAEYRLGNRGSQPDLVGWNRRGLVEGIEVKVRANINWAEYGTGEVQSQFRRYASCAPPSQRLRVIVPESRRQELAEVFDEEGIGHVWTILSLESIKTSLDRLLGPPLSDPANRLIVALARLQ